MNKLFLSHIKELTFVLQALNGYNINFAYHKKTSKLSFCSRGILKVYIIQKGSTLKIQKGSTLKIQKGSTLKNQMDSTLKIQKGSPLKIQKGSIPKIQRNSTLKIQKGSTLKKLSKQKCLLTYFMILVFFKP